MYTHILRGIILGTVKTEKKKNSSAHNESEESSSKEFICAAFRAWFGDSSSRAWRWLAAPPHASTLDQRISHRDERATHIHPSTRGSHTTVELSQTGVPLLPRARDSSVVALACIGLEAACMCRLALSHARASKKCPWSQGFSNGLCQVYSLRRVPRQRYISIAALLCYRWAHSAPYIAWKRDRQAPWECCPKHPFQLYGSSNCRLSLSHPVYVAALDTVPILFGSYNYSPLKAAKYCFHGSDIMRSAIVLLTFMCMLQGQHREMVPKSKPSKQSTDATIR